MEELEKTIADFLAVPDGSGSGSGSGSGYGYGSGSGSGYGYGYGDGDSDGSGYGYGYGSGSGSGSGSGYGSGYGDGITLFNGHKVYQVDGVPTIIERIKIIDLRDSHPWEAAEGFILNRDFTLSPCFVAKVENRYFAHGKTLHEAYTDACAKAMKDKPLEERINSFHSIYPDPDKPIQATELFQWHHNLTGSCRMGRESFCKSNGIDLSKDYTVRFFLNLCKDAYGKEAIRQLAKAYNITL